MARNRRIPRTSLLLWTVCNVKAKGHDILWAAYPKFLQPVLDPIDLSLHEQKVAKKQHQPGDYMDTFLHEKAKSGVDVYSAVMGVIHEPT